MSDYNSSLPVRTHNNGDVVAFLADGVTPSQLLAIDASGRVTIKLDDGSGNPITSQVNGAQRALDVGINVSGVQIDPRQIRLLTASDAVSVIQSTSPWVTSVNNLPATVDTNYGIAGASTLRSAAQIGNATGAANFNNGATGAQTLRVAANLAVAGADVTSLNPVPVILTSTVIGTSINDYNTSAALAANASSNHIYTITALKTFQGKKIHASASGKIKAEVRISPDGATYSTIFVSFNSTANPNIDIDMNELVFLESGTGSTIEVIRTNLDLLAQDVYSTISGTEV